MSTTETMTKPVRTVQRMSQRNRNLWYRAAGWITLIVLLMLWQALAAVTSVSSVATFFESVTAMWQLLTGPTLVDDVLPSIFIVVVGFAIASVLGVVLGLLIGVYRPITPWVHPVLEFLRAVPPPLIIPIALVMMGLGPHLVLFIIAFGAFWPVLLNTIDGSRRVEPLFIETARALQLSPTERVWKVVIPDALPTIMAGLRIALSMSLILMVLAEMLASSTGIGHQLLIAQQAFRVATTYGGVLLLAILGWLFDTLFVLIERRVLRNHPTFQGGNGV